MNQKNDTSFLITNLFVNGNNEGSLLSNKEFHIFYAVVSNDLKTKNKKIIGCFINPNDIVLGKSVNDIDKHIYFFHIIMPLEKVFNISELLKNTLYSKNYSNYMTKKILKQNTDVTIKKIIAKCEELLKENY